MVFVYRPSQNALGALSSVSMDIVTMGILMILVGNFIFEAKAMNRTSKLFFCLVLATIWALFLDYLNWAFDGSLAYDGITYWFTIGSLCMGSVLACLFSVYLYVFMSELHGLTKMYKVAKVCAGLNLVSFALTFALALTKTAFDFVDGHYETGSLYDVVTVIPVLTLLFLTGYLMHQIKVVGLHDIVAVTGYIIFMIAGALCEAAYSIGTTYVAVAIADVFIFIMLQNRVIAEERRNVKIWIEKSNTDELTGFYNRHAYEADMTELENSRLADNFVYVSIDVNGLKVENDTKGHAAGDELLLHASECLKQCFGSYGKIYRTGGDEFVAFVLEIDKDSQ